MAAPEEVQIVRMVAHSVLALPLDDRLYPNSFETNHGHWPRAGVPQPIEHRMRQTVVHAGLDVPAGNHNRAMLYSPVAFGYHSHFPPIEPE